VKTAGGVEEEAERLIDKGRLFREEIEGVVVVAW
jgi:hypothetical protein